MKDREHLKIDSRSDACETPFRWTILSGPPFLEERERESWTLWPWRTLRQGDYHNGG